MGVVIMPLKARALSNRVWVPLRESGGTRGARACRTSAEARSISWVATTSEGLRLKARSSAWLQVTFLGAGSSAAGDPATAAGLSAARALEDVRRTNSRTATGREALDTGVGIIPPS